MKPYSDTWDEWCHEFSSDDRPEFPFVFPTEIYGVIIVALLIFGWIIAR